VTGERGVSMCLKRSVRLVREHTARCSKHGTRTQVIYKLFYWAVFFLVV